MIRGLVHHKNQMAECSSEQWIGLSFCHCAVRALCNQILKTASRSQRVAANSNQLVGAQSDVLIDKDHWPELKCDDIPQRKKIISAISRQGRHSAAYFCHSARVAFTSLLITASSATPSMISVSARISFIIWIARSF